MYRTIILASLVCALSCAAHAAPRQIVICTDIASDIDDAWALGFAMKCPELSINCAVVSHGPTPMRGKVASKLLSISGLDDVPVLIGRAKPMENNAQRNWARDFVPRHAPVAGAARALARRLMRSKGKITLVTLGPLTDIGRMLELEPSVKDKIDEVILMGGSIYSGHGGSGPCAEYNTLSNVRAAQTVFGSGVPIVLVGLDVTRMMQPSDADMARVASSSKLIPKAMHELFKAWGYPTPTFFDPVAIAIAFQRDIVRMEPMCIEVTNDGYTRIVPEGKPNADVCVTVDKQRLMKLLFDRLLN